MSDTGKGFWEKTKYKHMGDSDQDKGLPKPPLQLECDPDLAIIDLPSPAEYQPPTDEFKKITERRRSVRAYTRKPLTLEELSYLLWSTQGVTKAVPHRTGGEVTRRIVPSAGARHAFETYLSIINVEGLTPGLYRYLALEHKLVEISTGDDWAPKIVKACLDQSWMLKSGVIFLWAAVTERMTWRYGERGYRYMLLDAGHVGQNMYLAAESINAGSCAIGAYDDDVVNGLLGLDGEKQFVIYIGACGHTK